MSGTQVEIRVTFVANDRDAWPEWLRQVADQKCMDCDIARDTVRKMLVEAVAKFTKENPLAPAILRTEIDVW